jgi:hypothetical protein
LFLQITLRRFYTWILHEEWIDEINEGRMTNSEVLHHYKNVLSEWHSNKLKVPEDKRTEEDKNYIIILEHYIEICKQAIENSNRNLKL